MNIVTKIVSLVFPRLYTNLRDLCKCWQIVRVVDETFKVHIVEGVLISNVYLKAAGAKITPYYSHFAGCSPVYTHILSKGQYWQLFFRLS